MPYRRLIDHLETEPRKSRVVSLPDGSVDRYYRVLEGRDRRIASREAFGERIAAGHADSFRIDRESREAGGQAVNMARQAQALDDDVSLFGHLDHPVLESFPFETTSMGAPARVDVLVFEDEELMFAEPSRDLLNWSVQKLLGASGAEAAIEGAEAICCGNWVSLPGVDDFLRDLSRLVGPECSVVFDPGSLTGSDPGALETLIDSLTDLGGDHRTVLSANADEMSALLDGVGIVGSDPSDRLDDLRTRTDLDGVLIHEKERAIAATPAGAFAVPSLDQRTVRRRTGAGDRFDGGLAHALASGWDWDVALALGNACASYCVANVETASRDDLVTSLRDDSLPD